ncbi:hypothetical protein V9948_002686 [Providencia rettgeri]|nr:hypothetical protein [Providencia rettgeri]
MYSTGTVTTTANSTKLVGTGTKWLNNINRVSAEQAIQIQIGTTVYNNSIQSIQSDTELTLNFPLPTSATGAKYVILTTMVHSVSDAMNKIVSMNGANVQFSDILTRWMTEQGIITVTLPDQTTQQLRTTKEMDKQLDGKLNKLRPEADELLIVKSAGDYAVLSLRKKANGDGERVDIETASDASSAALNIIYRDKEGKNLAVTSIPKKNGTAMHVGDYGFGIDVGGGVGGVKSVSDHRINSIGYVYSATQSGTYKNGNHHLLNIFGYTNRNYGVQLAFLNDGRIGFQNIENNIVKGWHDFYTTANTTKDSNGNLKAASPIVKVFADHIETNDESEGVTLKKLHTGIYQLHGVLGLHSDASWGGINGGITIPCGINQLPLVFVKYDVLEKGTPHPFDLHIVEPDEDGDIVLYTSYRPHELPQDIQYERFKLYPEFLRDAGEDEEPLPLFDGKVELTPGALCDIPRGHWVDVRVNMPSNSIYNQKQAEAERLAKLEAERLEQEEAKRAAEEAERAEQEAAEQVEQQ